MDKPVQWIIEKKRDGHALTDEEIRFFIRGYSDGLIPDYQASALAMAICIRGMTTEETAIMADAMMRSGAIMEWPDLPGPKVDKHSTGGVGDNVSLALAPLAAACGLIVPMMSGRGLGITGGTLDKLESIPGFRVNLEEQEIRAVLSELGFCMMGQTQSIAPADRKLYALRDVTATVPSIPLIVASIMSKKLAEGAQALVLDVKCGAGAFMKKLADARSLAAALIHVGAKAGRPMAALITDMNQPLGCAVGNALEVKEALEILRNRGPDDLRMLTLELCGHMLKLGGLASSAAQGRENAEKVLQSGAALNLFRRLIALQGGNPSVVDDSNLLPSAKFNMLLTATESGYVVGVNAEIIGRACMLLGAGRKQTTDSIDPAAGMSKLMKVGQAVNKGGTLAVLHANSDDALAAAMPLATTAFQVAPTPPAKQPLVLEIMQGSAKALKTQMHGYQS